MSEVTQVRTPSTASAVLSALADAWNALFGQPLPGAVAALLMALVDLETATFGAIFNHNLGNMVAFDDSDPFFVGSDSGNIRHFQAFESLPAGADAIVRQLTRDSRKHWRAGLLTGSPVGFVRALGGKNGGPKYFEAKLDRYQRAFNARYARYAELAQSGAPNPSARQRSSAAPVLALLALALTGAAVWGVRR